MFRCSFYVMQKLNKKIFEWNQTCNNINYCKKPASATSAHVKGKVIMEILLVAAGIDGI